MGHKSNRLFRRGVEPAGGCVWVGGGEGAWLHPSDWSRLLPCRPPPTVLPTDWGREVGSSPSSALEKEQEKKKKDT